MPHQPLRRRAAAVAAEEDAEREALVHLLLCATLVVWLIACSVPWQLTTFMFAKQSHWVNN
jgi:hypothetical protein